MQLLVICQMLAKFSGVGSERNVPKLRKRKKKYCSVFTYSIKRACEKGTLNNYDNDKDDNNNVRQQLVS